MKLLGKKAIVTGANRSIGKAIAIAFAQEGADVVISYRSDEQVKSSLLMEVNPCLLMHKLHANIVNRGVDTAQQLIVYAFFIALKSFLMHNYSDIGT